jgi:hypothetical protein
MRIPALITLLVLSLFATALADAAVTPASIKACANKKSGALRLLTKGKCSKKKERALSLGVTGPAGTRGPQGAPGSAGGQGPAGIQGPTGVQGPNGTPDTSNFFTKSESDARFATPSSTVDNANLLESTPARAFAYGSYRVGFGNQQPGAQNGIAFGRLSLPAGTGFTALVGLNVGYVEVACSDPSQTTIRYTHAGIYTQDVFIDDGGLNPVHSTLLTGETMSAGILSGIGQLEHLTIQSGFGATQAGFGSPGSEFPFGGVSTYTITAINAPGGDPRCLVQGQAVGQALGQ